MGTFADSLFTGLMSWVRALVNAIWALFSSENTTFLEFLGKNWLYIVAVIVVAGLVIDWIVWMMRWQPYKLWRARVRKTAGERSAQGDEALEEADAELEGSFVADEEFAEAMAAYDDAKSETPDEDMLRDMARMQEEQESAVAAKASARQTSEKAQHTRYMPSVAPVKPSEIREKSLGVYPGMRYGSVPTTDETRAYDVSAYAAVHSEGPGAAEVNRRRGEINAWQLQMEEEARQQAQRQAELARVQRERDSEALRRAQEAYEAEQARLAQEEYARQMAEYERQRAQYEQEMAEYERQKAAYDAAMAAQQSAGYEAQYAAPQSAGYEAQYAAPQSAGYEAQYAAPQSAGYEAQYAAPQSGYTMRYSAQNGASYGGAQAGGEAAGTARRRPAAAPVQAQAPQGAQSAAHRAERLLSRVSQLVEDQGDDEIAGIASLPPRVDVNAAYRPAKRPTNR